MTRRCAVAALLAVLPLAAPGSGSLGLLCSTPMDCALNGLCTGGHCVCDKPWKDFNSTSGACTMLDMLPIPTTACGPGCAYHGNTSVLGQQVSNSSAWGARVLPAPAGGKGYVMAVAEGAYGCDFLATWRSNSQTALAVSDTPLGQHFRSIFWSFSPQMQNLRLVCVVIMVAPLK